jgi:NAD-dependent dihydropyrimidine dehydrogenase PreA subunit
MIELLSTTRCIGCNICVRVCPTNVFEAVPDGLPTISRQADCQTCFQCEAHCPVDALFVAVEAHAHVDVDEAVLERSGHLGSYRRALGWAQGGRPAELHQQTHELRVLVGTGAIG